MKSIRETQYFHEAIHEINYAFGTYFLFDGFVVAEINEDEICTWETHGKKIVEDLTHLYDNNGKDFVYITHRIHTYSLKPADWLKFIENGYKLKGYGIVTYTQLGFLNAILEKLFINTQFKRFKSLDNAISWAKMLSKDKLMVS
ncbi:hypothetical protein [Costertonia aggregata]|uniref:STAS/SEC14 domain-containing protein n=1 Tax=Costertonia aggregata TaxID=343403 RepID=A0A7H9AQ35_9FLAO|nr:hypothetical protein [Costertonia aggregata]QLG45527.1 hypothetical protein HYG79_09270 [Costertonia aggregata]